MYSLYNKFVCDLEFEVGYVFEMDESFRDGYNNIL